jgi:hypothetical protein
MYDFWYALGVATIKPSLLVAIMKAKPTFPLVPRVLIEFPQGLPRPLPVGPYTGTLEENPTTAVREAMAAFLQKFSVENYSVLAPPVGIYCAGRFSQLITIPYFNSKKPRESSLSNIFDLAHTAYLKAVGKGPESKLASFPAFLGVCLMDTRFSTKIQTPTPEALAAAAEFGISPDRTKREWNIAQAFVKRVEFRGATYLLQGADKNPWSGHVTSEQIFFWPDFNDHVVL